MSWLRIAATVLISAVVFIAASVIEEKETFFGPGSALFSPAKGPPSFSTGSEQDPDRLEDRKNIQASLAGYNNLMNEAGGNGVVSILENLPASEEVRSLAIMEMRMALERDLPRPVGRVLMRLMEVDFNGENFAIAHTVEDWEYGDAVYSVTPFQVKMLYEVRLTDGKWIIEGIFPESPFEENRP